MIPLEQAVASAQRFATQYFSSDEMKSLRLEEVDQSEDGKTWRITLGWVEPAVRATSAGGIMGQSRADIIALPRVYKQFLVNGDSGDVVSMKMRDI